MDEHLDLDLKEQKLNNGPRTQLIQWGVTTHTQPAGSRQNELIGSEVDLDLIPYYLVSGEFNINHSVPSHSTAASLIKYLTNSEIFYFNFGERVPLSVAKLHSMTEDIENLWLRYQAEFLQILYLALY